jgi:hypothetical protein
VPDETDRRDERTQGRSKSSTAVERDGEEPAA